MVVVVGVFLVLEAIVLLRAYVVVVAVEVAG